MASPFGIVPAAAAQPVRIVVDTQQTPARSGTKWVQIFFGIAVLVAAYYAWSWFADSVRLSRRRTLCEKHSEQISVLLHCFRDAGRCVSSVFSLLRNASCPNRVRVMVYQELDAGDPDVHSLAMQAARNEEEAGWVHALRVVSTDDASNASMGSLFAWRELLRGFTSKWVLVTRPGVQADAGWDIALLETWRDARVDRVREIPVVSAVPPRIRATRGGARRGGSSSSEGAMGVARDWINSTTERSRRQLQSVQSAQQKHVFPTVADFRGRFPELAQRTFPRMPKHPVPTVAASASMAFGPRAAFVRAMRAYPCEDPVADYAVDWVLSAMLWSSGARFFAPPSCPFSQAQARDMRPKRWDSRTVGRALRRDHADYAAFAGVDMDGAVTSGRARMGLLPELSSEDILSKYGSRATFDRIRRGFE